MKLLIFIFFVSTAPFNALAEMGKNGTETYLQSTSQHTINVGKLRKEIDRHQEKIKKTKKQEGSVLDSLEQIDRKLAEKKRKILGVEKQLQAQEELLALRKKALEKALLRRNQASLHVQNRLRAYYLTGKTGLLNVTFSSAGLPDLMLFNDSFHELLKYDDAVIQIYRDTVSEMLRAKDAQELEKSILIDLVSQFANEKDELTVLRGEQQQLLASIKTRKGLYKQALQEMKKAENTLTTTLGKLREKEENRVHGFALGKGSLPPPVKGALIHGFQSAPDDALGELFRDGITIEAADQSPVMAIYDGTIIYAGYMRGYGNMIIIDHGLQYYSVTARLDQIITQEGQKVKQGEQVATTGDIATLFQEGVYFQIRHGAEAKDPLQWLQPGVYTKKI